MIYDQIVDNTFDYYDTVFRRIQPLARRETAKVQQEQVNHMAVFDDAFLANAFDKWRTRYLRVKRWLKIWQNIVRLFFAGINVENWRDQLQLKIDLQPDLLRLRKRTILTSLGRWLCSLKHKERKSTYTSLIGNAPSAVVHFWDDDDPRLRYVSIIESAVGFEVQAKNTIVNYYTPPFGDKHLSTEVHGLQYILRDIESYFEFEYLTVPSVSHFSAYLQGRLLNFGLKKRKLGSEFGSWR